MKNSISIQFINQNNIQANWLLPGICDLKVFHILSHFYTLNDFLSRQESEKADEVRV